MLSVNMTVDITLQFSFVYAPFQMSLYLLSVPAGEGQWRLLQKRIEMNSISSEKDRKRGV